MNVKNYQYLTESLAKLGFGDVLNGALKTKMELGFQEFDLKAKAPFGKDVMQYELQFGQGKSEMEGEKYYFLNRIKATLTKQNEQPLVQEFPLFKGKGYDAKEMFNLLDKRPVYKTFRREGENVGRWVKLDFNNKDENGNAMARPYYDNVTNFDLAREVSKLNLPLANQQEKEDLLRDLRAGDKVNVTIRQNGRTEKAYISVAPQIGGLVMYNSEMKEIRRTNSNNMTMVADDTAMNATAQKDQKNNIPETTKNLVEKSSKPDVTEGVRRKVS